MEDSPCRPESETARYLRRLHNKKTLNPILNSVLRVLSVARGHRLIFSSKERCQKVEARFEFPPSDTLLWCDMKCTRSVSCYILW